MASNGCPPSFDLWAELESINAAIPRGADLRQVYEMTFELGVRPFWDFFYSDASEWTRAQHVERGDSSVRTRTQMHPGDTGWSRRREFTSPFNTPIASGIAHVQEEQSGKFSGDGTKLAILTSVLMSGDVPYCDYYRVHTLLQASNVDSVGWPNIRIRIFAGATFHKSTMFEGRIRSIMLHHTADSWAEWEEKAREYVRNRRETREGPASAAGVVAAAAPPTARERTQPFGSSGPATPGVAMGADSSQGQWAQGSSLPSNVVYPW
jgi:hypothetical protein